ncbi:hypothetical protein [Amycolatopsis sp. NPDC004625]|uniref:hypothetical protein n=1 Tax=Amycolatopsis sp. NPDC004625 TaxID=3154670 RepID=UPI0033A9A99B
MTKQNKPQVIQIDTSARGRTFRLAEAIVDSHGHTVRARGLGETMIELAERAGTYRGRVEMQVKDGDWSMTFDAGTKDAEGARPTPASGAAFRGEAGDDRE